MKQLPGFLQQIMCVQFSGQSGEHLLASGNDNCIRVWNNIQTSTSNSTPTVTLTGHIGNVWSARFAPDNWKRITSGGQDRTIKVWDLQRGACVRTIFSYSSVNDLCLTDDAGVISGHSDHTVRYWDSKTGDCIKELSGIHAGQITSISVSPDAFQILTCSRDNTLKAIDIRTFKLLCTFENESFRTPANYSRACYSPDGRYVAAGSTNGQVFVWNAETGKIENVLLGVSASNPQLAVSWSPESQGFLVSCSKTDGSITLFE